jgi:hypothetical protein
MTCDRDIFTFYKNYEMYTLEDSYISDKYCYFDSMSLYN